MRFQARFRTALWPWTLALGAALLLPVSASAAATAVLNSGVLQVTGDGADDTITVRLLAGDTTQIEVLSGAAVIGTFARAAVSGILVNGGAGNDIILISDANGTFTDTIPTVLQGGDGNDTITGGAGGEGFDGGPNDDVIVGLGGIDVITGGDGNDTITGGPGNESQFGGNGDDTLIWNPGDGSDTFEGEAGTDTMTFNGSAGAEIMAAAPNGLRVTFTRNLGNIVMDLGTMERVTVNMLGGDDTITIDPTMPTTFPFTIDGGDGNDTISGGPAADTLSGGLGNDIITGGGGIDGLSGGDGNDTITGGPGNELHLGGLGDDTLVWNPGDGSDIFEGEVGTDTMVFNGSAGAEIMAAVPNGTRLTFTRNLGNIVMDLGTMERVTVNMLGGDDVITVDPTVPGTMPFTIDGGDGNDTINAGAGADTLLGGLGNDIINGGAGIDSLNGGDGNDTLTGGPGNDPHLGGAGDDVMVWNPGDGNDAMDGEASTDTMLFNGSAGAELMAAVANGQRITFTRNLGNIVMDVATTEQFTINGLAGNDTITIPAGLVGLATLVIDAGAGDDIVSVTAAHVSTLVGNSEIDALNFDGGGQATSVLDGQIVVGGLVRATFNTFESVNVTNAPTALPTITITAPTADPTTTAVTTFITLAGTAADDTGVASVAWVNDRGGSGAATGTTSWTAADIPLVAGTNRLTVTATDLSGNRQSDTLVVDVTLLSYYLAEGATGTFFDTDLLLANPNLTAAPLQIQYLKGDGSTVSQTLTLAPTSQQLISIDGLAGLQAAEVSASIRSTSGLPIVAERTMRWDTTGYGSHTEKATNGPATAWYFAEGSQGFFDTFVLLANTGTASNQATVQFLIENGAPVSRTYQLLPTSRTTVYAGSIPELVNRSFGIVVTFTTPGVAERAMYFGTPTFNGGHESAGVNAPSTSWFLAEGATGSFFTTFLLLANPGATAANVTLTYLPASGAAVTRTHPIPAYGRLTINLALEAPSLADAVIATAVQSSVPILVERAQYWPFLPSQWLEAHNSFGATAVGTKWGLAEGRVGLDRAYQTYILLANSSTTQAAQVRLTFLRTNGTTVVKTYTVNPSTRFNVQVNTMVPELVNETFGTLIEVTNGVGIFVERALYSDAGGVVWAAGTNALATRLP